MKYLNTITKKARQRGTTLIELSVVIAVLLLLVGVLFIGITAWKNGANTAACIINLSSIQKAARGYANMNQLNIGARTPVSYFDDRRLLGDGAGLPSWRNLHTYGYGPVSRSRLHDLQPYWSRSVDNKFSQLVTSESLSRTRENNQSLRAQKNNCDSAHRPVCASRLAPEVTEVSGWYRKGSLVSLVTYFV